MERLEKIVNDVHDRLADVDVDDFEIYARRNASLEIESKEGSVEQFNRMKELGVAVRVIRDGKMGISSSSDFSEDSMTRLISNAVDAMRETEGCEDVGFPEPLSEITPLPERPGKPLDQIPESEKIDAAINLERAALDSDPRVVRARHPRYREVSSSAMILNSCGVVEKAQRSLVFSEVQAVAEQGGKSESAFEIRHSIRFEDLNGDELGRLAGKRAAELLGAGSMKTGRYRAYFEPRAAAAMLRVLIPSFFADNVQRSKSRLGGKLGRELFSPLVTVVDDGLFPGGVGSFLFDGEGVWHQRTTVIQRGAVKGWLYDGSSARRDGVSSTGNAYRPSIHAPPQIAITNSFISEGARAGQDIIRSCDGGLWISDLMGLHTANTVSGDFSLGAVGFTIENGSKGKPVRGIMVAGNIFDLFRSIDGVGNDLEFFGQYGAPSISVSDVQVNGDH